MLQGEKKKVFAEDFPVSLFVKKQVSAFTANVLKTA